MQSESELSIDVTLMKLLSKIHVHEAQLNLLKETMKNNSLLVSKILSSLQPRIGREFSNNEIESQKEIILRNTRKQLLTLAIKEKELVLDQLNNEFNSKRAEYTNQLENPSDFLEKLAQSSARQCRDLNETITNTSYQGKRKEGRVHKSIGKPFRFP